MIYAQPCPQGLVSALGFVIPKKSIRHAVQRNRVRRWARAFWQTHALAQPHHLLVRCRGKPVWSGLAERRLRYAELTALCRQAYSVLVRSQP